MKLFDCLRAKYFGIAICHTKQTDNSFCQKRTNSAWGIMFFKQDGQHPSMHSSYLTLPEK